MYFEEPWFIDLNLRLNSFRNCVLMSSVENGNISDYEEGEIVDDDDAPSTSIEPIPAESDKCKGKGRDNVGVAGEPFVPGPGFRFSPNKNHVREPPNPEDEKFVPRRLLAKRRRQRLRRIRKQLGIDSTLERPPVRCNVFGRRRPLNSVRERSRADTPYEERLKELQRRTRRLNSCSKSESESYSKSNSKVDSKTEFRFNFKSGSSSKSGSRPNSKSDSRTNSKAESKLNTKFECKPNAKIDCKPYSKTECKLNLNSKEDTYEKRGSRSSRKSSSDMSSCGGTSLLKRLVGSGSVAPSVLEDGTNELNKIENVLGASENAEVDNAMLTPPLSLSSMPIIENETSTKTEEYDQGELKINESVSFPSIDPDDELFKLRMEALKTAVLKKHSERLKRGYVPKKTIKECDDPFIDTLIEEVESVDSYSFDTLSQPLSTDKGSKDLNLMVENADSSDMSLDSNYVSDDDAPEGVKVSGLKRKHIEEYDANKKPKLNEDIQGNSDVAEENSSSDVNDDELELRALALQSFLVRKNQKICDKDDVESPQSELSSEKIEIEPKVAKDEIKVPKKRKSSENWEELDEDILRAQLLKTLSASLPEHMVPMENTFESAIVNPVKSTPSFLKKELDPELELQSKLWSESMVPKLVISLGSDSESESEPSQIDFVKSLDLLLQEAKEKSEKVSAKEEPKPKVKKKTAFPKQILKKPPLRRGSSSTPVAVKHLPIQQQEEYRRLKLKLAEKMNSNKSKVLNSEPSSNTSTQSLVPSKTVPFKQPIPRAHTLALSKQKQVTLTSKSKTKLINRVDNVLKKTNVPTVGATPLNVTSLKPNFQPLSNLNNKVINRVKSGVSLNKSVILPNGTNVKSKLTDSPHNPKTIIKNSISPVIKSESIKVPSNIPKIVVPNNIPKVDLDDKLKTENADDSIGSIEEKILVESIDKKTALCSMEESSDKSIRETTSSINQSVLSCVNIGIEVSSSLDDKDTGGNCDKENKMTKQDEAVLNLREKENHEVITRSGIENEGSDDLMEKLKDAEKKYGQSLSLVLRLEKQLEEARKTLTAREKTVSDLKQLMKGPIGMATLSVKVSDGGASTEKANETASVPGTCSVSPRSSLDPDGVLCPFELSGCCKDPFCTFNHIHT